MSEAERDHRWEHIWYAFACNWRLEYRKKEIMKYWRTLILLIVPAVLLGGCAAQESFIQPGNTFEECVQKEGPYMGAMIETSPTEGEVYAIFEGGFVLAVFDRREWGYAHGETIEISAGENVSFGGLRVKRVEHDWHALPGVSFGN